MTTTPETSSLSSPDINKIYGESVEFGKEANRFANTLNSVFIKADSLEGEARSVYLTNTVNQLNSVLKEIANKYSINRSGDNKTRITEVLTDVCLIDNLVEESNRRISLLISSTSGSTVPIIVFNIQQLNSSSYDLLKELFVVEPDFNKPSLQSRILNTIKKGLKSTFGTLYNESADTVVVNLDTKGKVTSFFEKVLNKHTAKEDVDLVKNLKFKVRSEKIISDINEAENSKKKLNAISYISLIKELLDETSLTRQESKIIFFHALSALNILTNPQRNSTEDLFYKLVLFSFTKEVTEKFINKSFTEEDPLTDAEKTEFKNAVQNHITIEADELEKYYTALSNADKEYISSDSNKSYTQTEYERIIASLKDVFPSWFEIDGDDSLDKGLKALASANSLNSEKLSEMGRAKAKRNEILPIVILEPIASLSKIESQQVDTESETDISFEDLDKVEGFEKYIDSRLEMFNYGSKIQSFEQISRTVGFLLQQTENPNKVIAELAKVNLAFIAESFYARFRALGSKAELVKLISSKEGLEYLAKVASEFADFLMLAKFGSIQYKDKLNPDGSKKLINIGEYLSGLTINYKLLNDLNETISTGAVSKVNGIFFVGSLYSSAVSENFYSTAFKSNINPTAAVKTISTGATINDIFESKLQFLLAVDANKKTESSTPPIEFELEFVKTDYYTKQPENAGEITYQTMEAALECGVELSSGAIDNSKIPNSLSGSNNELRSNPSKGGPYDILKEYAKTFYKLDSTSIASYMEKLALFSILTKVTDEFRDTATSGKGLNISGVNVGYASLVSLFYKIIDNQVPSKISDFLNLSTKLSKEGDTNYIDAYINFYDFLQSTTVNYGKIENTRNFQILAKSENSSINRPYLLAEIMALKSIFAIRQGIEDSKAFIWDLKDPFIRNNGNLVMQRLDWYLQFLCSNPANSEFPDKSLTYLVIYIDKHTFTDFPLQFMARVATNPSQNSPIPPTIFAMMSAPTNQGDPYTRDLSDNKITYADKYPSAYSLYTPIHKLKNSEALLLYSELVLKPEASSQSNDFNDNYAPLSDSPLAASDVVAQRPRSQLLAAWSYIVNMRTFLKELADAGMPLRRTVVETDPALFTSLKDVTSLLRQLFGINVETTSSVFSGASKEKGMKFYQEAFNKLSLLVGGFQKENINKLYMFVIPMVEAFVNRNFEKIYTKDTEAKTDGNPITYWDRFLDPNSSETGAFKGATRMQELALGFTTKEYTNVITNLSKVKIEVADKYLFPSKNKQIETIGVFSFINTNASYEVTKQIMAAYIRFKTYFGVSLNYFPVTSGQKSDAYKDIGGAGTTTDKMYVKPMEAVFQHMRKTFRKGVDDNEINSMKIAMEILEMNEYAGSLSVDDTHPNKEPIIVVNNALFEVNDPRQEGIDKGFRLDPWNGMQIINSLIEVLSKKSLQLEEKIIAGTNADEGLSDEIAEISESIVAVYEMIADINVDLAAIPLPGTNVGVTFTYEYKNTEINDFTFRNAFGTPNDMSFSEFTKDLYVMSLFAHSLITMTPANIMNHSCLAFHEMWSRRFEAKNFFNLIYTDETDPRVTVDHSGAEQFSMLEYLKGKMRVDPNNTKEIVNAEVKNKLTDTYSIVEISASTLSSFAESVAADPKYYLPKYPRLLKEVDGIIVFEVPLIYIDAIALAVSGICLPNSKELDNVFPIVSIWSEGKVDLSTTLFGGELGEYKELKTDISKRVPLEVGWIILSEAFHKIKETTGASGDLHKFCKARRLSEKGLFNLQLAANGVSIEGVMNELKIISEHSNILHLYAVSLKKRVSDVGEVVKNIGTISKVIKDGINGVIDVVDDFLPLSVVGMRTTAKAFIPSLVLSIVINSFNPLNFLISPLVRAPIMFGMSRLAGIPLRTSIILSLLQIPAWPAISITNPIVFSMLIGNMVEKRFTELAKTQDENFWVWRIMESLPVIKNQARKFRKKVASTTMDGVTKKNLKVKGSLNSNCFDPKEVSELTGADYTSTTVGGIISRYSKVLFGARNEQARSDIRSNLTLLYVNWLHCDVDWHGIEGYQRPESADHITNTLGGSNVKPSKKK